MIGAIGPDVSTGDPSLLRLMFSLSSDIPSVYNATRSLRPAVL